MASTINASTTGGGGIVQTADASGVLQLQTGGTAAVTVDASQNVGIGTASPGSSLDVQAASGVSMFRLTATTGTNAVYSRYSNTGGYLYLGRDNSSGTDFGSAYSAGIWSTGAYPMLFGTNGTERMRIDSNGNVLVGTSSFGGIVHKQVLSSSSDYQLALQATDTVNGFTTISFYNGTTIEAQIYYYKTNDRLFVVNTSAGVYLANNGTSWTSNSDERKKDIIEPIENGLEKVSTLRSVIGKYKADEEGTRRAFLIAQDVQAVLPEAVDSSDPDDLGVQYTDVIPLLVASIKELKAIVDTQAEQIKALEAK